MSRNTAVGIVDLLSLHYCLCLTSVLHMLVTPWRTCPWTQGKGQPEEKLSQDFYVVLNIHLCTVHWLLNTQIKTFSTHDELISKWIWNALCPWILVFYQKATVLACTMWKQHQLAGENNHFGKEFMFKNTGFLLRQKKKFDSLCVKQIFNLFSPIHSF